MTKHHEMKAGLKIAEMDNGRRAGIIGTAAVGFVALIALLIVGFRGRHIGPNAAALTMPVVGHIQTGAPEPGATRPR